MLKTSGSRAADKAVESVRSQNTTVTWRRSASPTTSAEGAAAATRRCGDRLQQPAPIPQRDAKPLQIGLGEVRQNVEIDVRSLEGRRVLLKSPGLQPVAKIVHWLGQPRAVGNVLPARVLVKAISVWGVASSRTLTLVAPTGTSTRLPSGNSIVARAILKSGMAAVVRVERMGFNRLWRLVGGRGW